MAEEKCREFLSEKYPNIWKMFNNEAKRQIPKGFIEFLSGQSEDKEMEKHLLNADKTIKSLLCIVGESEVADKYRKKISTIKTEHGLAELLCEIKVVESLARISEQKPELQPGTKINNKKCEIKIVIDNTEIYVEAKRYEDKGPRGKRALNKRSMEISEKINGVPNQFPDDTLNILFIFHSGYGSNPLYICQVLFGENACTIPDGDAEYAENDGLFSTDSWSKISGCAYVSCGENLLVNKIWQNPNPKSKRIPEKVLQILKDFNGRNN